MDRDVLKYSFKVWLVSGMISFLLYQIPLYYFYHDRFDLPGVSYLLLNREIALQCMKAMSFLLVPWLFIIRCVRALYQFDWSLRGFKWVILLVSEFLTMFFLLDGICIININLIMPTATMLFVFAASNFISVYIFNPKILMHNMRARAMEME